MSSAYEAWVMAIRAWRVDPRHDLSRLPPLVAESLPPSAFERLFDHIVAAQQHVMDRWSEAFWRDWGTARDSHSYSRVLMASRVMMARRLQLAAHPGLPEEARRQFTDAVGRDIRKLQHDLEQAAAQQSGHRIDRTGTEFVLQLLRTNRLTAILEPGFPLQALIDGRVDTPPPAPPRPDGPQDAHTPEAPPQRRRRSIIIDN